MAYNTEAPVLDTYQAVVSAYSDFLTVAIHTILYERNIYPENSWIKARKYNYPVRQNRHPKVCQWIQDAVAAVEIEMLKVGVRKFDVEKPRSCITFVLSSISENCSFFQSPNAHTMARFSVLETSP